MATGGYNLRSATAVASVAKPLSVPSGYTRLDVFNSTTNKYGKYSGIQGKAVDETGIWVKEYNGGILLWWESPVRQIDDFAYYGDRQQDIDACYAKVGYKLMQGLGSACTWHHTGYPHTEASGTMQLVPTNEHAALSHIGGMSISKRQY